MKVVHVPYAGKMLEVIPHHRQVDAGGHGRVGGEDGAGADGLERLAERESVGLQVVADPLQAQEPGCPGCLPCSQLCLGFQVRHPGCQCYLLCWLRQGFLHPGRQR